MVSTSNMAVKTLAAVLALILVLVGIPHAMDATSSFSSPFVLPLRANTRASNAAAAEPGTTTTSTTAEVVLLPAPGNAHTESRDQSKCSLGLLSAQTQCKPN